ncbi:MAG TPA: hypothetical protein VJ954_10105, partial [Ignavibacteriaceae bacterium]|nr:hypothetical protein [Ignavibacteriaceae bacterium]
LPSNLYTTYVLYSVQFDKIYIGQTSDLKEELNNIILESIATLKDIFVVMYHIRKILIPDLRKGKERKN